MANWHGYLLIRDIPPGWDNNLLWGNMGNLGEHNSQQPAENNHMRVSLNGRSAIIEALFDEAEITRDALIQFVADALGRNPGQVDASLNITLFAEGGTWEESRQACVDYLIANSAEWESVE